MVGPSADHAASEEAGAFDALYDAHQRTVHAFLLGRTGDPDLALDLVQEVFIRAWRNLSLLLALEPSRQRAWLFAAARNLVIDQHRGLTTRNTARDALAATIQHQVSTVDGPEEIVVRERDLRLVDEAISRLPEALRTVLTLQALGEHTSAEIGNLLGRPAGTVRYQLSQARKRLAEELRELDAAHELPPATSATTPHHCEV